MKKIEGRSIVRNYCSSLPCPLVSSPHNLFKTSRTKEEALSNRPEYVNEADWKYLCDYFDSAEFKVISERNKKNRSQQKAAHTSGTKSILRHKHERESKEGRKVGPIELYDMTHFSRKKNDMVDETSSTKSAKMKELQLQSQSDGSNRTEEDICIEVDGHVPGYVRGRGALKPRLSAKDHADIEEAKKKAEQAEKRAADLEVQVKVQQELMEKLESQQRQTNNLLQSLTTQLQLAKQDNTNASGNTS